MVSAPSALPKPQPGSPCPCGSGQLFDTCCGPGLAGTRALATAEALMRSRFTAHVADDWRYLHLTYGPTTNSPFHAEADDVAAPGWSRISIHAHETTADPDHAFVEFTAFFADQNGEHPMQEKSEFRRADGKWLFTRTIRQDPAPVKSNAPKVGRNDPCPCGSGKKYKHCCLAKA
jgi:SEC-C motif-containing protein